MNYIKEHLRTVFTPYEIELLRYFYLCLVYEGSKFLIMLIFFSALHLRTEFLIGILVLLSLRNFYGGLHFQRYISCFAFTFGFTAISLLLAYYIHLSNLWQIMILLAAFTISCFIGPIASSNRPPLSKRQERIYHICGIFVFLIYLSLFITWKTFPYSNICFWVIVLQTLQLAAAKILTKGEQQL